jgi:hypothetical protein
MAGEVGTLPSTALECCVCILEELFSDIGYCILRLGDLELYHATGNNTLRVMMIGTFVCRSSGATAT